MHFIDICHITLPAYWHVFGHNEDWTESKIPEYYLDLAVPSKTLYEKLFLKVNKTETFRYCFKSRRPQFNPDDCINVGVTSFPKRYYSYALSKKKDRIGMNLFNLFFREKVVKGWLYLESGESAVRFLNMVTVFGVGKWKDASIQNDIHPMVDRHFWSIYPSILRGLYKKKNEHPLLVSKVWEVFCPNDATRLCLFEFVPDADHLEFMLQAANRTRFDFWGMRHGSEGFTQRIVLDYIKQKRFELVEILLKYGFALEEGITYETETHRTYPIIDSFLTFDWDGLISNNFLVWLLATVYATDADLVKLPQFIELYRKLYFSLSLPSEPPSVVRENLQQVCSYKTVNFTAGLNAATGPRRTLKSIIEGIIEAYVECDVHSSHNNGMTPRKLTHISRRVVREKLGENYQLPTAIDDSKLPTFIKSFLKLEV